MHKTQTNKYIIKYQQYFDCSASGSTFHSIAVTSRVLTDDVSLGDKVKSRNVVPVSVATATLVFYSNEFIAQDTE